MYYSLRYDIPTDDEGGYYDVDDGVDFEGVDNWANGHPFEQAPPNPIVLTITPISGFQGGLPEMMDGNVCLMSERLVKVLEGVGVDNLDKYPAVLRDSENEREFFYQAVNILGLVAAADLGTSEWVNLDGEARLDTHFDKLAIDEHAAHGQLLFRLAEATDTIVIHEKVKVALEAANFPTLLIEPLE